MKKIIFEQDIYTCDIDSSRHVSNISYIKWMEFGGNKLSVAVGIAAHEIDKLGFAPVLVRTEIDYKKPLYLGDSVRVELFLSELKKISGNMTFHFYNQHEELVAVGVQKGLFFSLENKKPYRLPEEQRQRFTQYLIKPPKASKI